MIVCCVLKSGGHYDPEYVYRLKEGIDRNLDNHDFVCLSDISFDLDNIVPLEKDWPGWWSKIEAFKMKGKVLYFDLDTVITGNLKEVAEYPHRFTMLQDFIFPDRKASGVMAWTGDYSYLYENFDVSMIARYKKQPRYGDGGYIQDHVDADTFQDLLPGQIMSRKTDKNRQDARVVCYHGTPRPNETGWAA